MSMSIWLQEDNEYLRLLEAATSRTEALRHLQGAEGEEGFMVTPSQWVDDIDKFETMRVGVGRAIEAAQAQAHVHAAASVES